MGGTGANSPGLGVFAAGKQRYRAVLVSIYFAPVLVSAAALGILWSQLLSPIGGGVGYVGTHLGLGFLDYDFLGDPHLVLGTVIVLIAWEFLPFHMLLVPSRSEPDTTKPVRRGFYRRDRPKPEVTVDNGADAADTRS